MTDSYKILVFTIDLVFAEILKRVLERNYRNYDLVVLNSFSDAKTFSAGDSIRLILVDDHIVGTSSYELISFLRLNRKFICPIVYFGVSEYDGERKAIMTGANHFVMKPFNPDKVEGIINISLQKHKMQYE